MLSVPRGWLLVWRFRDLLNLLSWLVFLPWLRSVHHLHIWNLCCGWRWFLCGLSCWRLLRSEFSLVLYLRRGFLFHFRICCLHHVHCWYICSRWCRLL